MSRIKKLFDKKKQDILSIYFTAGFPALEDTMPVLHALQEAGADMIELGVPYSDPLADGPVIQRSGSRALANGMSIATLFEQLKEFRNEIHIPVLLMGYMNPVMQYGFDRFCQEAATLGIDGLILPDLPAMEFETEFGKIIRKAGLDFVFLVTPETSDQRVKKLDELSSGFLYAVSSSSTTGKHAVLDNQEVYFRRLRGLRLKNPVMIGFGIRDRQSFYSACRQAQGAIVGTAFIEAMEKEGSGDIGTRCKNFIQSLR